jgi:hypothetical protein
LFKPFSFGRGGVGHTTRWVFEVFMAQLTYRNILINDSELTPEDDNIFRVYSELTDDEIRRFEGQHNIVLPVDFCCLLKAKNGGFVRDGAAREEYSIDEIYALTVDLSGDRHLFAVQPLWQSLYGDDGTDNPDDFQRSLIDATGDPTRLFVFSGDGHSMYAFDFRSSDYGGVVEVEIECGPFVVETCEEFRQLFRYW